MKETSSTPEERARKRSLPDLLLHKFLTEYGYARFWCETIVLQRRLNGYQAVGGRTCCAIVTSV
jgi:hypothetical protein